MYTIYLLYVVCSIFFGFRMLKIFNKDISISWPMLIVIAPSLPLFLSLSFSKDSSRKDNCSHIALPVDAIRFAMSVSEKMSELPI